LGKPVLNVPTRTGPEKGGGKNLLHRKNVDGFLKEWWERLIRRIFISRLKKRKGPQKIGEVPKKKEKRGGWPNPQPPKPSFLAWKKGEGGGKKPGRLTPLPSMAGRGARVIGAIRP